MPGKPSHQPADGTAEVAASPPPPVYLHVTPEVTPEVSPEVTFAASATAPGAPLGDVRCASCDELLVARSAGGSVLQVWERHVLRPHRLTGEELPLRWVCRRCGLETMIETV